LEVSIFVPNTPVVEPGLGGVFPQGRPESQPPATTRDFTIFAGEGRALGSGSQPETQAPHFTGTGHKLTTEFPAPSSDPDVARSLAP